MNNNFPLYSKIIYKNKVQVKNYYESRFQKELIPIYNF